MRPDVRRGSHAPTGPASRVSSRLCHILLHGVTADAQSPRRQSPCPRTFLPESPLVSKEGLCFLEPKGETRREGPPPLLRAPAHH